MKKWQTALVVTFIWGASATPILADHTIQHTIQQLQAQILSLLAQLEELQRKQGLLQAGTSANLVANPGFEADETASYDWTQDAWQAGCQFTFDSAVAHSGSHSAKIYCPTYNDARWLQTVSVEPNTEYVLSGWIKTDGITKHSPFDVSDVGANLSVFGTWSRSLGLLGTNDWSYQSVRFDSGENHSVQIGLRLGHWSATTIGTAWFDDVRLTRVGVGNTPPIPIVIAPPPPPPVFSTGYRISVLTQNNGEEFMRGAYAPITWRVDGVFNDTVNIFLMSEGLFTGDKTAPSYTIARNVRVGGNGSTETLFWVFGGPVLEQSTVPDGKYRIQVCPVLGNQCDTTDQPFTLRTANTYAPSVEITNVRFDSINVPINGAANAGAYFYFTLKSRGAVALTGVDQQLYIRQGITANRAAGGALIGSCGGALGELPLGASCDLFNAFIAMDGDQISGYGKFTPGPATAVLQVRQNARVLAEKTFSVNLVGNTTPPPPPPILSQSNVPLLISPAPGAVLDNGRADRQDSIIWDFDWNDVPGATAYHLYVIGQTASFPLIDKQNISQSSYHDVSVGSYIIDANRYNWSWKVRAFVNGVWSDWSEVRRFNVEPLDSDPPSTLPPPPPPSSSSQVDLRVSDLTIDSYYGLLSITVCNGGTQSSGLFEIKSERVDGLGGKHLLTGVGNLSPGDCRQYGAGGWIFYSTQSGSTYRFRAVVDPNNQISEQNENNNTFEKDLTIPNLGSYDLSVGEFQFLNKVPQTGGYLFTPGEAATLHIVVSNLGTQGADNIDLDVDFGQGAIVRKTIAHIDPNQFASLDILSPVYTAPGKYTASLKIDPTNKFTEANESNNNFSIIFWVGSSTPPPPPPPATTTLVTPHISLIPGNEFYSANGKQWVRYWLGVDNWADYVDTLFALSAELPPCGLNSNASRTWVNIYNGQNGAYIYGYCGFDRASYMNKIWFAVEQGTQAPPSVYVTLVDRKLNTTVRSNTVSVPNYVLPSTTAQSSSVTANSLDGLRRALGNLLTVLGGL